MCISKENFKKEVYIYISEIVDELREKAEFKTTHHSSMQKRKEWLKEKSDYNKETK